MNHLNKEKQKGGIKVNLEKFKRDLVELINKHSIENLSDTTDWILAEYLVNCLHTFQIAMKKRDFWNRQTENLKKTLKETSHFDLKVGGRGIGNEKNSE